MGGGVLTLDWHPLFSSWEIGWPECIRIILLQHVHTPEPGEQQTTDCDCHWGFVYVEYTKGVDLTMGVLKMIPQCII